MQLLAMKMQIQMRLPNINNMSTKDAWTTATFANPKQNKMHFENFASNLQIRN